MIGKVSDVRPESANNNFKIMLKSATDFYNLEFVYAIKSTDAEPVKKLMEKAKAATN